MRKLLYQLGFQLVVLCSEDSEQDIEPILKISLETGKAQGADVGEVATIGVKVEGGRLLLDATYLGPATKD